MPDDRSLVSCLRGRSTTTGSVHLPTALELARFCFVADTSIDFDKFLLHLDLQSGLLSVSPAVFKKSLSITKCLCCRACHSPTKVCSLVFRKPPVIISTIFELRQERLSTRLTTELLQIHPLTRSLSLPDDLCSVIFVIQSKFRIIFVL